MKPAVSSVASVHLLLAVFILAAGWPGILAAAYRLPIEADLSAIEAGHAVDQTDVEKMLGPLESASGTSPSARADLAFALLADSNGASGAPDQKRVARAAAELEAYLARTPGDSLRWATLANAELLQRRRPEAMSALKMSILTAPWSSTSLVLWRCGVGIDLYPSLDDEGRRLLEGQFRVAAERSADSLVQLARRRNAVEIARSLLASSPEAAQAFETRLQRAQ